MFGEANLAWLRKFLPYANGIPSHDAIGNFSSKLSPEHFKEKFVEWMKSVAAVSDYSMKGTDFSREISVTPFEIRTAGRREPMFSVRTTPDSFWAAADRQSELSPLLTQSVGDRLFIDSILDDRPITPSFHEGLKAQEVIDAAMESDRTGRWVSVPGSS